MLPLVCNDASAILFMFDLTRETTLIGVKDWYHQARAFNKVSFLYQNYIFIKCFISSLFNFQCVYHLGSSTISCRYKI